MHKVVPCVVSIFKWGRSCRADHFAYAGVIYDHRFWGEKIFPFEGPENLVISRSKLKRIAKMYAVGKNGEAPIPVFRYLVEPHPKIWYEGEGIELLDPDAPMTATIKEAISSEFWKVIKEDEEEEEEEEE